MNPRIALYELAARYRLPASSQRRLLQLAALHEEPASLRRRAPQVVAVLAAALGGFGIVMWIAANWGGLGRFGRFAVLEAMLLILCAVVALRPRLRIACGLLAMLTIGALFALFGQTYQTGADAWQLFAWWAVLALPLCLTARSDVLWGPWALISMVAIALWIYAHAGYRWAIRPDDLLVHTLGWSAGVIVILLLGPLAARWTGAGMWALRTAVTLGVVMLTLTGAAGLFQPSIAPHYLLALLMLGGGAAALARRVHVDVFTLSAVVLGLNVLLVGGLAHLLLSVRTDDPVAPLFVLGLVAAVLLAVSVSAILRLVRRAGEAPADMAGAA